jgi:hypothetical protein
MHVNVDEPRKTSAGNLDYARDAAGQSRGLSYIQNAIVLNRNYGMVNVFPLPHVE